MKAHVSQPASLTVNAAAGSLTECHTSPHAIVDVLVEHYWPLVAVGRTCKGSKCFGSGRGGRARFEGKRAEKRESYRAAERRATPSGSAS